MDAWIWFAMIVLAAAWLRQRPSHFRTRLGFSIWGKYRRRFLPRFDFNLYKTKPAQPQSLHALYDLVNLFGRVFGWVVQGLHFAPNGGRTKRERFCGRSFCGRSLAPGAWLPR